MHPEHIAIIKAVYTKLAMNAERLDTPFTNGTACGVRALMAALGIKSNTVHQWDAEFMATLQKENEP